MKNSTLTRPQDRGFTRMDLLAVLLVLGLLALTLLPALARTKADSRAFQCLNNLRDLSRACRMWSDDNQDLLLYAADRYVFDNGPDLVRAWVSDFTDVSPATPFPWTQADSIRRSPTWPYCGKNLAQWRCPADLTTLLVNGALQPRVRSYAMNVFMGGWSGSDAGAGWAAQYRLYLKYSDIVAPTPAEEFLLTEFRPRTSAEFAESEFDTAMDGFSPRNPAQYTIGTYPGHYHDGAGDFAYADGRAELHHWVDRRTTPPYLDQFSAGASPRNSDIAWLQDRATRPR